MNNPTIMTTAAEATGSQRNKGLWPLRFDSGIRLFAYKTSIPIAVSTDARPALNDKSRSKPKPTRPNAIMLNSSTSADSQGTNPPLTPSATSPPKEIESGR